MTSWPRYLLSMEGRGELECRWVVLEKERDREGERHRKGERGKKERGIVEGDGEKESSPLS